MECHGAQPSARVSVVLRLPAHLPVLSYCLCSDICDRLYCPEDEDDCDFILRGEPAAFSPARWLRSLHRSRRRGARKGVRRCAAWQQPGGCVTWQSSASRRLGPEVRGRSAARPTWSPLPAVCRPCSPGACSGPVQAALRGGGRFLCLHKQDLRLQGLLSECWSHRGWRRLRQRCGGLGALQASVQRCTALC